MRFHFFGRIYRTPKDEISLCDVWAVAKGELSGIGEATLKNLKEDVELAELHREVAWQAQAVIEFVDLLGQHIPSKGRWQHISYLYFEALSSLRESIVTGLNGSTRASLSVLRSAFEMFLIHCWWQERLFLKETFEPFYEWLSGEKFLPPFKNIVQQNFKTFNLPKSDLSFDKVMETYKQLCSYVHSPLLHESITTINAGNSRTATKEALLLWLSMTKLALRIVLEHLIFHKPMCLFPVDINKKFAFSPPVGMYFDQHNIVALQAALGPEMYVKYRQGAKDAQVIEDLMSFYDNQDDLTQQQILDTWSEEDARDFGPDVPVDIEARWILVKSRMRVLNMSFSYGAMETAFSMGKGLG
jgi:hypothetical protein